MNDETENVILEYNSKKGVWHFNRGDRVPNTNNFYCICHEVPNNFASAFCNTMEVLFPRIGSFNNPKHYPPYPSFKRIKHHFDLMYWGYRKGKINLYQNANSRFILKVIE